MGNFNKKSNMKTSVFLIALILTNSIVSYSALFLKSTKSMKNPDQDEAHNENKQGAAKFLTMPKVLEEKDLPESFDEVEPNGTEDVSKDADVSGMSEKKKEVKAKKEEKKNEKIEGNHS